MRRSAIGSIGGAACVEMPTYDSIPPGTEHTYTIERVAQHMHSPLEYDRLHRRCMNQRRELRRLNAKLRLQAVTIAAAEYHNRILVSRQTAPIRFGETAAEAAE